MTRPGPELHYLSLLDAAKLIRAKQLSPVDLTRAQLERIDALEPSLMAYAMVTADRAREEARRAEAEIQSGHYRGPLHGVPVAVKDLCFTAGTPTRGGSGALANHVPTYDATVVERFRRAGAVLLGKLNTTEGAMLGYHPAFEVPRNPWGEDRWPGWSSSGPGVATAAGLCFASLGTDTGGSIRQPAAANGVVGVKPTWGRVSRYGVLGLAPSLDHVGPLTRRVADAAAVLGVIAGPDEHDLTTLPNAVPDYLAKIDEGIEGVRIGFDEAYAVDGVQREVADSIRAALKALEDLGGRIVQVTAPVYDGERQSAWGTIAGAEAVAQHAATFPVDADRYGAFFRAFLEKGSRVGGVDYAKADLARREMTGQFNRLFQEIDILVCPSHPYEACRYDPEDAYSGTDREAGKIAGVPLSCLAGCGRFLQPFNFCGYPTLSLPCGLSEDGLPLSMQLIAAPLAESVLFRAGQAYENTTEWHTQRPPL
jgi:amidase